MTTPALPYNGAQILELRKQGKRPADMLLVSLIGWLGSPNPCVLAHADRAYDWRFLSGLDVLLVADSKINSQQVKATVDAILAQRPEYLGLWIADRQEGAHIAWGSFRPKTAAFRRMSHYDKQGFLHLGVKKI